MRDRRKLSVYRYYKVEVALSENTYLLVAVATFTVETRHVTQEVHKCAMYPEGDNERR